MTIGRLIKELEVLGKKHGMRTPVCANTKELRDSCNDAWPVVLVAKASVEYVEQCDGDGFGKYRKNGTQSVRKCLILE